MENIPLPYKSHVKCMKPSWCGCSSKHLVYACHQAWIRHERWNKCQIRISLYETSQYCGKFIVQESPIWVIQMHKFVILWLSLTRAGTIHCKDAIWHLATWLATLQMMANAALCLQLWNLQEKFVCIYWDSSLEDYIPNIPGTFQWITVTERQSSAWQQRPCYLRSMQLFTQCKTSKMSRRKSGSRRLDRFFLEDQDFTLVKSAASLSCRTTVRNGSLYAEISSTLTAWDLLHSLLSAIPKDCSATKKRSCLMMSRDFVSFLAVDVLILTCKACCPSRCKAWEQMSTITLEGLAAGCLDKILVKLTTFTHQLAGWPAMILR